MKDSIYVSKENYLKAILEAEAEGREVIPALLAHWLEVSPPAVTMALKRLKRDGFVEVGEDGIVRLTEAGRETAYHTALRHHLIERMLSEVFGMDGTRFTKRRSGWSTRCRLHSKPSCARGWARGAPVPMATPCCRCGQKNASAAERRRCQRQPRADPTR